MVVEEGGVQLLACDRLVHVPDGGEIVRPSGAVVGVGLHVGLGGVRPCDGKLRRAGYLGCLHPDFGRAHGVVPVLDFVLEFATVVVVYAEIEAGGVAVDVFGEEAVEGEAVQLGIVEAEKNGEVSQFLGSGITGKGGFHLVDEEIEIHDFDVDLLGHRHALARYGESNLGSAAADGSSRDQTIGHIVAQTSG